MIEALSPESIVEIENRPDSLNGIELLSETIADEVDRELTRVLKTNGIINSCDFLFDSWIGRHTAAFAHKDYDPSIC